MLDPLPIGNKKIDGTLFPREQPVVILPDARRKHVAIFGTTGAGKSTLMRNMIARDIAAGQGVTVIDPHGQLVEEILEHHIPRWRTHHVIYFNPKDPEHALPINLLHAPRPEQRGLVVANTVSTFHRLWESSWGPRMEDILRNALHALIEQPVPVSLFNLPTLLTDDAYRALVLRNVRNPVVLDFFRGTFDRWTKSFREEAVSPVLNKTRAFLTDPLMRAVIGPPRSAFDFRWMMDRRKILLCDLSKGAIGEDNAKLLGSLIVIKEKLAAFSRHEVPEAARTPHALYVEEAHNFIADFESILSESRKYRLLLTVATQGIESLSPEAAYAVFANCATLITFRVSGSDARRLRDEFSMVVPASNLQDLPDYKAYVRTLTRYGGDASEPSEPSLVATYPPRDRNRHDRPAIRERVIRTSTERWTTPRAEIDRKLARFLRRKFTAPTE